jgi:hypothetical protein
LDQSTVERAARLLEHSTRFGFVVDQMTDLADAAAAALRFGWSLMIQNHSHE